MASHRSPAPPGKKWVYSKWITRNGKRIYAKTYGYRAFPMLIKAA